MGAESNNMSKDWEVVVITTGGTIEKSYNEEAGSLQNREFRIKEKIINKLRLPGTRLQMITLLNKDSLDITHSERLTILECIHEKGKLGFPVVVLHGTDTMVETAELYAAAHPNPTNPPVVFTGAMAPLGFEGSDAAQNIAEALLAVRLLGPGVYVSFHNRILPVPGAVKNYRLKTFEMGK